MSLRERVAAWINPRAAGSVAVASPDRLILHPWLQEAGVMVTPETAPQVAAVYGCCRLIVDCLAPAPIEVVEVKANGAREARFDDPAAWTLNYGAPVAQAPDAPPSQAIEEALYWSALLGDGNGYAEIQWDGAGRFFGLWPIESERVTPRRDETGYYYEIRQPRGGTARLEAKSMFHVRGPSLKGLVGDSIVYRAAKAIGIAQAAQVYSAAYFANGTVVSGLLSSDKTITPKQAKEAIEAWNEQHGGGPGSAHKIAVTGQGLKYQPINHNAQESQLVESRRFQVSEIARFFGVPTTLLADNEAWTNLSELYRGFYTNALRPWAERFDSEATRKLFPQRQPWREVQHDLTHLTLGSFKEQVEALRSAVNGGLWTRNEARKVQGKNTIGPKGDVLVVEGTVKTLDDVLDPPEPPAPLLPSRQAEGDDEGEEMDPPAKMPGREMTHRAVAVMFARELERYARKLKNKRPAESIEKFRDVLVADCEHVKAFASESLALDLARDLVCAAAMGVEQGEPPDLAAERLLKMERP